MGHSWLITGIIGAGFPNPCPYHVQVLWTCYYSKPNLTVILLIGGIGEPSGSTSAKTCEMALRKSLVLLGHIQLFDRQSFNDKEAHWISSSKTKKNFFIVIPASLVGWAMCESRNLLCRWTWAFFWVYWVFVSRFRRFLVTPSPTHRLQGMTMLESKEWRF